MKKITALILALTLALSLAACNGKNKRITSSSDLHYTNEQLEKMAAKD